MRCNVSHLAVGLLALFPLAVAAQPAPAATNWPLWRGPSAVGVAPLAKPPIEWDESRNVRWKTPVPGRGLSSPVIWGNRLFVTTAIETGEAIGPEKLQEMQDAFPKWARRGARLPHGVQKFLVIALDRTSGRVLWQKVLREALPLSGTHKDGSWASGSAVTDGEVVIAHFGSMGTYCLDMNGKLLWERDLGDMKTKASFGEGTSPTLHKDWVIVNWDHELDSFMVALDRKTGAVRWQTPRDEKTSWATPIVVEHRGVSQVIVNATGRSRGYNIASGKVLWELGGMTANVIPCPVSADGIVYLMSGFRGNALQALRLDGASGDLTGADSAVVVWTYAGKNTSYTPSPLLYDGLLYFCKGNAALLSCFDAKTGKPFYEGQPLEGLKGVYASPLGADGRIYIAGRNGVVMVLERGETLKVLATNRLDDGFDASPAAVGDALYLRGHKHLYCLAGN